MIIIITIITTCIKLLLIPAYKSTDFEVHRNWLAITHSLPLKQWYYENTSEWTLDYPPLFAYFEYCLSFIATLFDKKMLVVENLNYDSRQTLLFQRFSVIVTDLLYVYGVYRCCCCLRKSLKTKLVLPLLLITNCGLIMVDHIHFQYNGFLNGFLLLSISSMLQGKHFQSAFWFTVLINFKHLYIYLAPAYFIYLLRHCCIKEEVNLKNICSVSCIKNFLILSSIVVSVFLVTFLPFLDQLGQIFSRLFPFKRGLCHAYWAPNIWALYNTLDKILIFIVTKFGLSLKDSTASMTGGLVQEFSHVILPNIQPITTIILTAVMMLPGLVKLWKLKKTPTNFLRCVVLCALTSFLFGWHVHEKAILMSIIPLTIVAVIESGDARVFLLLSTVGHYSLFPLLFPPNLLLLKLVMLVLYSTYAFHCLYNMYPLAICKYTLPLLNIFESLYILGLVPLFLYENFIHYLLGLGNTLPFLPLMMTSVYCSLGVIYSWLKFYIYFLKYNKDIVKVKRKTQ